MIKELLIEKTSLPIGWEMKTLGNVSDFQRGLTYSGKDAVDFSENIVLRANNIDLNRNSLDFSELKYLNNNFQIKENKKIVKGGLLICLSSGSKKHLGKVAIVTDDYNYAFGGFIGQIIPNNEVVSKYLFYNLISEKYKKYITQLTDGIGINNLKSIDLKSFPIPLPPLPQQKQIVALLDKAFAAIDTAKANAEQNLQNAKELFESYCQNIFENDKKNWTEKSIGEVCSLFQGLAINAKTKHFLVEKSTLPLLRIKDLRKNTAEQYVNDENYPQSALVNKEDLIYTRTGNSLGLVFRGRYGILHNNSFKIVPKELLTRDYLFIWLKNPNFKSKIFSLASKAAQPDITHKIFKLQQIKIPPIKEQQQIVEKINNVSAETKKLEILYTQKIADLDEMKKSVLQKAFSGQLNTKN